MSENEAVGENAELVQVRDGEFAGWQTWRSDAFEQRAGPFFEREGEDGRPVCAFRAEARHMNGAGFMHGGCLMTFADSAIFTIARKAMRGANGVTMNMHCDFLDAARVGQLIEATGEVTRAGGKTVYARGLITADAKPAVAFSGIIHLLGRVR